jgi:hypothetical protein
MLIDIGDEILAQGGQLITYSRHLVQLSLGKAGDRQQLHYQLQRQNTCIQQIAQDRLYG